MLTEELAEDVKEELQRISAHVAGAGDIIWRKVWSSEEQRKLKIDGMISKHPILQWQRLRGGTRRRAAIELAQMVGIISDLDYRWLVKEIGESADFESTPAPSTPMVLSPQWNKDQKELTYKGQAVRKIRSLTVAVNVVRVLDAFQANNWPLRIDFVFDEGETSQTLRETVASLNNGLTRIRFFSDGSGRGIEWKAVS